MGAESPRSETASTEEIQTCYYRFVGTAPDDYIRPKTYQTTMFRAVIGVLGFSQYWFRIEYSTSSKPLPSKTPMNVRRNRGSGQEYGQRGLS